MFDSSTTKNANALFLEVDFSHILLKIIKRKDVQATAKTRNAGKPKQISTVSEEKSEGRLRHELVKEISKWIPERGKNNRTKEVAAIRRLFGDDSLLDKT